MEKELVVALLLSKYKNDNPEDIIPEIFNILQLEEKIKILDKALNEKCKISELI